MTPETTVRLVLVEDSQLVSDVVRYANVVDNLGPSPEECTALLHALLSALRAPGVDRLTTTIGLGAGYAEARAAELSLRGLEDDAECARLTARILRTLLEER